MPIALAPGRKRERLAATRSEIAVARFVARSWKFNVGRRKFTDRLAVRPFC
jgi:hypothetical protein